MADIPIRKVQIESCFTSLEADTFQLGLSLRSCVVFDWGLERAQIP